MAQKMDIVIPLSNKSYQGCNDEIRIAIRSIKEFCSEWVNRIFVITEYKVPDDIINDIIIIKAGDIYSHEKDANIIHKIRTVIESVDDLSDDFIFWADDNFVTKITSPSDFTPRYTAKYEGKGKADLDTQALSNTWKRRLVMTLNRFPNAKFFNPHIPSMINKHKFIEMCNSYDYTTKHGITVFSWYYNYIKEEGVPDFDEIHLGRSNTCNFNGCRFVGYFDAVMESHKFRERIKELFPGFTFKSKPMMRPRIFF